MHKEIRIFKHQRFGRLLITPLQRSSSQTAKPTITSKLGGSGSTTGQNPLAVGSIDAEWIHDLHYSANSDRAAQSTDYKSRNGRNARVSRLNPALNGSASSPDLNSQFNIVG